MKRPPLRYFASEFFLLLVLIVVFSAVLSWRALLAADLTRGKILYDAHCAACHGIQGDGNGPRAESLTPPPTDFTSGSTMANVSLEVNEQVVAQGKPGTGMPAFGMILSPDEIQDVIAYQRAFLE